MYINGITKMRQTDIEKHNNCQCDIRWRIFSGRTEPVPGLFCRNHDAFLEWLTTKDALALIESGIQETPYIMRKKTKKLKQKASRRNKWKATWVSQKVLGI
jgi:hypothetical protein